MKPNVRLLIPLVLVSGLIVGGLAVDRSRAEQRSKLSGYFEQQPTNISSRVGGRVVQILAKEGQVVHKGDILAILEADPAAFQAKSSKLLADQAQAQLDELTAGTRKEEIARQEAVVSELEAALLKAKNGPLPEEIDAARAKVNQLAAKLSAVEEGPRKQELAQAKAAERQARAALDQAERGATPEERNQSRARLDAAKSDHNLALAEVIRVRRLHESGAVSARELDSAEARFEAAKAKLDEAKNANDRVFRGTPPEELKQAQEAYNQALARLRLSQEGSRDQDKRAARAELDAAKFNLKLLERGSRSEDLAASVARLNQAKATLDELRAGTRKERIAQAGAYAKASEAGAKNQELVASENVLKAPFDGVVERLLIAEGDLLPPNANAFILANPTDIWLRVFLPEKQLAKVKVGDEAILRVDGVSEPVTAVVESIATQGEFTPANLQTPEERGKQVFAIRIRLKTPDPRVKAGMYATVKSVGTWK